MNVPKLRFKEFNDEWKSYKLSDLVEFFKGNLLAKSDLDDNGKYPCILYGQLYTKYKEVIRIIESKTNRSEKNIPRSKKGDVLIPSSGETPIDISTSSCIQSDNILLGGDINILRPINCDGRFLSYVINNNKTAEIARVAQGHSVVHLYIDNLKYVSINVPSIKEQNKIADELELLDKKIELQSKKIEDLKLFKKGLLNSLLNKDLEKKVLLSDIAIFQNGKGHENFVDEDGKFILINSKFISTNGKIIKKCSKQLTPLKIGDIAMVMSDLPNGKALAKCIKIDRNNTYTLNQRICSLTINDKYDSNYIFYKINRNKYYLKFDDGVNQTNLKKREILNLSLDVPNYNNQRKYSLILTMIDNRIIMELDKIDMLQELKKGLMQNMFV